MSRLSILGLVALAACSSTGVLPPVGIPITGAWGGEHVRASLTDAGGAVEYDCAHGSISEALLPNGGGAFDVRGLFFREHGGPVRLGEPIDSVSARYTGSIRDNVMTLIVRLPADTLGPYTLAKGGDARVYKCL